MNITVASSSSEIDLTKVPTESDFRFPASYRVTRADWILFALLYAEGSMTILRKGGLRELVKALFPKRFRGVNWFDNAASYAKRPKMLIDGDGREGVFVVTDIGRAHARLVLPDYPRWTGSPIKSVSSQNAQVDCTNPIDTHLKRILATASFCRFALTPKEMGELRRTLAEDLELVERHVISTAHRLIAERSEATLEASVKALYDGD